MRNQFWTASLYLCCPVSFVWIEKAEIRSLLHARVTSFWQNQIELAIPTVCASYMNAFLTNAYAYSLGGRKNAAQKRLSYQVLTYSQDQFAPKDHPKARLVRALSFLGFALIALAEVPPSSPTASPTPTSPRTAGRPPQSSDPTNGSPPPGAAPPPASG